MLSEKLTKKLESLEGKRGRLREFPERKAKLRQEEKELKEEIRSNESELLSLAYRSTDLSLEEALLKLSGREIAGKKEKLGDES